MIKNFYEKVKIDKTKKPIPLKNFNKHHIDECSRILCSGFSGAGKTNSVIHFIEMTSGTFTKVIIFNGLSTDEPLYDLIKEKNQAVIVTADISEIPPLTSFEGDHTNKLIIFDDFISLPKNQLKIIRDYAIASRKKGFTTWFLSQDVIEVPKIISRNCNYILLYKMNDMRNIKYLMKLFSIGDVPLDLMMKAYFHCVNQPLNFFMLDLKTKEKKYKYRCGFETPLNLIQESESESESE